MKEHLITSGYPRSGNTYLNSALNLLFYPNDKKNVNRHTIVAIEKTTRIIVPFRHPINAITSWHHYPSDEQRQLQKDIAYYVRFYSYVLNNLNKIYLMNFDQFTTSIDYIVNRINSYYGFTPMQIVTDKEIKTFMLENDLEINLPRNNQDELNQTKMILQTMPEFEQCLELHAALEAL